MLVLWSHSNNRKSSWNKANICYPKTFIASQLHLSRLYGNTLNPQRHHTQMVLHHTGSDLTSVTRTAWLPSRLLQLVRTLVTARSLDAISPARHTGAETSVAKQPHIVTGHFSEAQTLVMMLPIQVLVPYTQDSNFAINLAADVLAPHGARSLVETWMTISFNTFPSQFDWQSMIFFTLLDQKRSPKRPYRSSEIYRSIANISTCWDPIKYTCPWISMWMINCSHNIRHKCLNWWLAWYSIYSWFVHYTFHARNKQCTV